MVNKFSKNKGFTIIEIMVTIAIIGLLSAIVIVSMRQANSMAQDRERISDLAQIQFALKLYKVQNGNYPTNVGKIGSHPARDIDIDLNPFLYPLPSDRNSGGFSYRYEVSANCTRAGQRVLYAQTMENESMSNFNDVCTCTGNCDFQDNITPVDGYIIILSH